MDARAPGHRTAPPTTSQCSHVARASTFCLKTASVLVCTRPRDDAQSEPRAAMELHFLINGLPLVKGLGFRCLVKPRAMPDCQKEWVRNMGMSRLQ